MFGNHKVIDMTEGNPVRCVLQFALPVILGNLLQQFYALADAVIVGRFVDLKALAAIGGTGWVRWAITGICMDCAMGFGIVASQRIGAKDLHGFKDVVAVGIEFILVIGLPLTVLLYSSIDLILHALHIPGNIYSDARQYLLFAIISTPIGLIYNMGCSFLRASGNSRGPFIAIVISTLINIVLDLWFIVSWHMGVKGAAQATLTAQIFAAVYILILTVRKEPFRTERKNWRWNPIILRETARLWIPLFFNSIAISLGGVIVQRHINAKGAVIAAGIDAGEKIYCLLETIEKAVCSSISTFVGQNLGAGKIERIRRGMWGMTKFAFFFSLWLAGTQILFGDFLISLFLNKNQNPYELAEAYSAARIYLNVQSVSIFFMVPMHFYRGAIQALGYAVYPLIAAIMQIAARWIIVAEATPALGVIGLCLPDGAAAFVSLPFMIVPYYIFMRKYNHKDSKL